MFLNKRSPLLSMKYRKLLKKVFPNKRSRKKIRRP